MPQLDGKRIAILATDGFEQSELLEPKKALEPAGAKVEVVSPKQGHIRGWKMKDWADTVPVDRPLSAARVEDFDGLVLPGGQINPDLLRVEPKAVQFVRDFFASGKPVGAICHGPWLLIEAGVIKGCRATSYHSIKTDMKNAGAHWVDEPVVVDKGLVTSRKPDDLKHFSDKLIEEFAEGRHHQRMVAQRSALQRDPKAVAKLFAEVEAKLGPAFILVSNAGIGGADAELAELDIDEMGPCHPHQPLWAFYCCQHFIRARRRPGGKGKIINITSVHEEIPTPEGAPYGASKAR